MPFISYFKSKISLPYYQLQLYPHLVSISFFLPIHISNTPTAQMLSNSSFTPLGISAASITSAWYFSQLESLKAECPVGKEECSTLQSELPAVVDSQSHSLLCEDYVYYVLSFNTQNKIQT